MIVERVDGFGDFLEILKSNGTGRAPIVRIGTLSRRNTKGERTIVDSVAVATVKVEDRIVFHIYDSFRDAYVRHFDEQREGAYEKLDDWEDEKLKELADNLSSSRKGMFNPGDVARNIWYFS